MTLSDESEVVGRYPSKWREFLKEIGLTEIDVMAMSQSGKKHIYKMFAKWLKKKEKDY